MPCFVTHSVINGEDTVQNRDLAVKKGLAMSHQLAKKIGGEILVIVPNIQHLENGHVLSALGDAFAKQLKKTAPFDIQGITISRTSKIPSHVGAETVVWMLWPSLVTAESVSKACQGTINIVATEWVPFDELHRWRLDNKAKSF
ncbi:hypothetical protein [Hafnia psychrotolerans]|uniref:Uncharacterized protein n=1 Tax=Hafnia psychrotolerans TaxID=1477018 RepID=A0ABQ1G7L0_9GAMM|nr:hypothetical protein [Hafnia psychrotolerans]GGA38321.1 hypothetical protein GCM10011328_11440 [Hafnia psychrotolerans]